MSNPKEEFYAKWYLFYRKAKQSHHNQCESIFSRLWAFINGTAKKRHLEEFIDFSKKQVADTFDGNIEVEKFEPKPAEYIPYRLINSYPVAPQRECFPFFTKKPTPPFDGSLNSYKLAKSVAIQELKNNYRAHHRDILELPKRREDHTLIKIDLFLLREKREKEGNELLNKLIPLNAENKPFRDSLKKEVIDVYEATFNRWIGESIGLSYNGRFSYIAREYYLNILNNSHKNLLK